MVPDLRDRALPEIARVELRAEEATGVHLSGDRDGTDEVASAAPVVFVDHGLGLAARLRTEGVDAAKVVTEAQTDDCQFV